MKKKAAWYYISISSMQNILEWGNKSGPHRKTFTKRKRAPKFDNKLLCAASLSSASAIEKGIRPEYLCQQTPLFA